VTLGVSTGHPKAVVQMSLTGKDGFECARSTGTEKTLIPAALLTRKNAGSFTYYIYLFFCVIFTNGKFYLF
jgi:hypothetical protein